MFQQLSQFDLHHRLAAEKADSLVFFGTRECASCRHLKQVLGQLAERRPAWRIFEVDAEKDMALTREFEIFHLPALFLFHQGAYHRQLQCQATPAAIEAAVAQALQQPPEEAP